MLCKYFTLTRGLFVNAKNGFQVCKVNRMDALTRKRVLTYERRLAFLREHVIGNGRVVPSRNVHWKKKERAGVPCTNIAQARLQKPVEEKLDKNNNNNDNKTASLLCEETVEPQDQDNNNNNNNKTVFLLREQTVEPLWKRSVYLDLTNVQLRLPKFSVQQRLLVTKSDNKVDTKDMQNPEILLSKAKDLSPNIPNVDAATPSPQPDCPVQQIEVQSINEVCNILQKFPMPKSVLHNFYQLSSAALKDPSLKIQPLYKAVTLKPGVVGWNCSYQLKWPVPIKISAQDFTKKKASHLAAGKALNILVEQGRITSDGSPLIFTKNDVKQITKQKQTQINLDSHTLANMKNIINIYNEQMREVVQATDFDNYCLEPNEVLVEEPLSDGMSADVSIAPRFLGVGKYLAREKVVLPISAYKDSFISLLRENRCVIVKGEPGCGKSSRVPQYVLESWIKEAVSSGVFSCKIAVTQPRRIAAISLSDRVSSERDEELGYIVGYQVRLKSNFQQKTGRILYCTTGILLRHLQSDPNLSKFSHVILDEAHERDVNTDLLMNLLKRALNVNEQLKLVVMSATIDTAEFSDYFDGAPVFSVPGFTYPVKRHFLEELGAYYPKTVRMCQSDTPQVIHDDVVEVIKNIHHSKPEGAILVFLPGWEDLSKIQKLLNPQGDMVVYLVHSKLKDSEQRKIFSRPPPGVRKVVLATNIAETSITIDDVVYVIDTGVHKDKVFDVDKGINVIDMDWISKASANQRAGRAGRCSPGESFHLYSRERFDKFPDYSSPKILSSSLTKVVLDSKVFANNMDACEFMNGLITPPEGAAVRKAVYELKQLELLDENEKLTPLGRALANFQLEPGLAKAMVNGVIFKCASPIVDIVTLFSSDSGIFGSLSLTDKEAVKRAKSQFSKSSDHLALMRMYEMWSELREGDGYAAQKFCRDANLASYKLEFVEQLKKAHFDYLYKGLYASMPVSDDFSDNDELVKAVLYSGTGTVLEHRNWDIVKNRLKTSVNVLVTRNNHKATITSESVNYKRHKFPSNFLVYINETRSNIRRTTIVRECSLLPAVSVLLFNSRELEIVETGAKEHSVEDNLVLLSLKGTKLQCLCDREQAQVLISCKQAIEASYKYLIHQLTYAGEDISDFLESWDDILRNLDAILSKNKID